MTKRRAVALALVPLGLAGCATSTGSDETTDHAASLWEARTPYIGDNSRVAALVTAVGPARPGSYTLQLHPATSPYALTVSVERLDKPSADTDFRQSAALLLGLIGNADAVTFTSDRDTYTVTTAGASKDLGFEVKRLGQDQRLLEQYLAEAAD